jgi:hypothetical protein
MKRDMDLVRQILLALESEPDGSTGSELTIDGYSDAQVGYHVLIMMEAGLLVGAETTSFGSGPEAIASRLTWEGHEFLDAAREPSRWEQAKKLLGKAGGASFPVWVKVLTEMAVKAAGVGT